MISTQRRCAVDGCERIPEYGWARCRSHVEEWLDRLLKVPGQFAWRATRDEMDEFAREDWAPGEIAEVWGK